MTYSFKVFYYVNKEKEAMPEDYQIHSIRIRAKNRDQARERFNEKFKDSDRTITDIQ